MSKEDFSSNPFSALFASVSDVEKFKTADNEIVSPDPVKVSVEKIDPEKAELNNYLEKILQVTVIEDSVARSISNEADKSCVFLEDLNFATKDPKLLNFNNLDQALFERIMLEDPSAYLTCDCADCDVGEKRILFYLYRCFSRLKKSKTKIKRDVLENKISSQAATFLSHPEIFPSSQGHDQLVDLLQIYHSESGHPDTLKDFIVSIANCIEEKYATQQDEVTLTEALSKSFESFRQKLLKMSVVDRNLFVHLDLMQYFFSTPSFSLAVIEFSTPTNKDKGRDYQDTLIGAFLSASCLPRRGIDSYEFFDNPSHFTVQEHNITVENLWMPLKSLSIQMSQYFYKLLKQSTLVKEKLLDWIANCLNANSSRSKIWNSQFPDVATESQCACDGFILNLESVLLQLCKPFTEPHSLKLLKIQPSYSRPLQEGTNKPVVRLRNLARETCLITREDTTSTDDSHPNNYNFVTEMFYFTHYALHIGFKVVQEQLTRLSQDLGRTQRLYEDTVAQGGSPDIIEQVKVNMEKGMTKFLSLKAALLESESLELMVNFHVATSTLLIQLASVEEGSDKFIPLSFPLPKKVPASLYCIPELIVENIKDCIIFIKHFSHKNFQIPNEYFKHLMSLVLVFMGNPERMKNPHLRASLAEMLEAIMPPKDTDGTSSIFSNYAQREKIFVEHPFATELVPTLLNVFVSIEMTGQSVAFEQKFQYRRPMYTVLEFLWNTKIHCQKMEEMAREAEENIEASNPPLFLRFINLLMNDAIFLLDEALSYMSQLRELQQQRDRREWLTLTPQARHQNEANFQHMGLLARFHNVMGNETIRTLRWITSRIKSIFCHPMLVERIAGMLNYFFLHLVGPMKKNFRVKDLGVYEFKPQDLVVDICRIYLHLGEISVLDKCSESRVNAFCSAVSRDGRSYSPELFSQAEAVLLKIGHTKEAVQLLTVAKTIAQLAEEQKKDEATLGEIPDEFLDPIMSTLMLDPVILPSSGIYLDRATISRHLLSDQTDPFNRTPLSMDMVKPANELRSKIEDWLKQQRS